MIMGRGKNRDYETPPVGKAERKAIHEDEDVIEAQRSSSDRWASYEASEPMTDEDRKR
jgi:hypothetical protein